MVSIKKDLKEELKEKRIRVEDPFTPTRIGEYQLLRLLGKESYGNVYMATNKQEQLVALKETQMKVDSKSIKRIRNEIEILRLLNILM
jgi:serine/threonine protein kinase